MVPGGRPWRSGKEGALVEMLVVAVAGTVDDSETVVEKVGGIDAKPFGLATQATLA